MVCSFDIYHSGRTALSESQRTLDTEEHKGVIYETGIPGGLSFGYYKIDSRAKGQVMIKNEHPYLQLSHMVSGRKSFGIGGERGKLASFKEQEYNYLFLSNAEILLEWESGEILETFEVGLCPELVLRYLPEEHPIFPVFRRNVEQNISGLMSETNLALNQSTSRILYDMLHCPLEGYYKQLYMRSKTMELLAIQLEEYEHRSVSGKQSGAGRGLKKEEVERMYHVRDIILSNMNNPCSLIDLAHQVGTNDAYLKKHFKEVFGTTVFGYLHDAKMREARKMLLEDKTVTEVAYHTGYRYVAHFTRAFKKYFGVTPNQVRK